jgi:hypothetical protein
MNTDTIEQVEQLLNDSKYVLAFTDVFDKCKGNERWTVYGFSNQKKRDSTFKSWNDGFNSFGYKVRVENGQVIIDGQPVTVAYVFNQSTKGMHRRMKQIEAEQSA